MPEHPNAAETSVQSIPVPPSPQAVKSSNEILCELFGAFNAKPPPLDDITPQDSQGNTSEKSHKKHKKHSSKKKHKKVKKKRRSSSSDTRSSVESKRKTKKHKKDSSKSGSESVISSKKNKRKLGKFSASDSDSDEEELKSKKKKSCKEESLKGSSRKKYDNVHIKKEKEEPKTKSKDFEPISIQESILKHAVGRIVDKVIDSTNLTSGLCESAIGRTFENSDLPNSQNLFKPIKEEPQSSENQQNLSGNSCNLKPKCESEQLPKNGDCDDRLSKSVDNLEVLNCNENTDLVSKHMPVADVFTEDLIECGVKKDDFSNKAGKPKVASGKITIQNLKFSQVFEATVKQIEEEAKLKAEKYEEGELSESSEEREKSLTPSEISSSGSVEEIKVSVKKEKSHRHKHRRERHHHSGDGDRTRSESREKHRSHSHRERSRSRHRHRERHSRESKKEQSSDIVSEKPKERSKDRNKERSPDRTRERSKRSRSKDRVKERTKERPRSRERSEKHRHGRSTSRDKVKRCSEDKIDKQKLLEIARKNALSMMKNPSGVLEQTKVAITSGGKTVNELTDFCKLLSKKDADGHESISSNTSNTSDSESEKPFHHPFQLKDRPSGIVLNIRNSVALPVKSLQEKTAEQSRQLRLQFPVSSGQHHRKTESQWIPVSPKKTEATTPTSNTQVAVVKPTTKAARVFKDTPEPPDMDISSIVSQRLLAMRRLQENPTDADALTQMYAAQQNMQSWAESKQQPPGQFTGSTGVKVLSQAELSSGFQAWARRDQLQMAAPVTSGMGMALLQKMGWRPGEGLGKNKEGTLQPLLLEVKMDKKGLVAQEELPVRQPHQVLRGPAKISLEGKHPVSLLNEYCCRRKFGPPYFELVDEAGPDHKKNFLFKVRVNGVEYKPAVGSPKKKQARAEAAEVCLKALGIFYNK